MARQQCESAATDGNGNTHRCGLNVGHGGSHKSLDRTPRDDKWAGIVWDDEYARRFPPAEVASR